MLTRHDILTSELCDEIDMLREKLEESQKQEAYWRDEYNKLIKSSIRHNEEMIGNTLKILLAK